MCCGTSSRSASFFLFFSYTPNPFRTDDSFSRIPDDVVNIRAPQKVRSTPIALQRRKLKRWRRLFLPRSLRITDLCTARSSGVGVRSERRAARGDELDGKDCPVRAAIVACL